MWSSKSLRKTTRADVSGWPRPSPRRGSGRRQNTHKQHVYAFRLHLHGSRLHLHACRRHIHAYRRHLHAYRHHLHAFRLHLHLYLYVWSSRIARVWINRVRLPILLVVSGTGKRNISLSPFAPENLVSRDGFGSPVPRQLAHRHAKAESGARDSSRVPRRRLFIYSNRHTPSAHSPELSGYATAHRWRSLPRVRRHRASIVLGKSPWTN